MDECEMMDELRLGLERAHKTRGKVKAIAVLVGIHPSTVFKVMSGNTNGFGVPNYQRLWAQLYREGHVDRTIKFPIPIAVSMTARAGQVIA